MNKNFRLTFLGTEACDMDWTRYGEEGIYGSTQTLVNGTVLIDAGRTGFRSLARFQVAPESLEEVWFTHYHDDHCFPAEIAQLVQAHGTAAAPLVFRGTALLLEALRDALPQALAAQVTWEPYAVGHAFQTHGWTVTPLLANHADDLYDNLPVHYLVEGPHAKFLYALDHLSPTALYGVRFERGTKLLWGDRAHFIISGTASIDREGQVLFTGDVRRQTARVMENVGALLAEQGGKISNIKWGTLYLRDIADAAIVLEELAKGGLAPEIPLVVLKAPVCRPAWLVELECIAVKAENNPFPVFA